MKVDWDLAERLACAAAGDEPAFVAPARLQELAAEARDHVVAATGLRPARELPAVEWIGREGWIKANLETMRSMLGPALERAGGPGGGLVDSAGGAVTAAELGALLGMFSRRVLGQYELDLLHPDRPARLLLVAPNIDHAVRTLDVDREQFVAWVTLHEITHAVQFSSVPWLAEHLGGAITELLGLLDVRPDPRALLKLDAGGLRALIDSVREGGLLGAVLGEDRRALLERVQGTMGLVEGHAEWAMDHSGDGVPADVEELREKMDRRRADRQPLLRILDRLLGFDLKLRQYTQGREFCDAVVAARGREGLTAVWAAPELAPTPAELAHPSAWLARTA